MKQRCLNPKSLKFKDYGGRGIKVCQRWMDFANFFEDMGPRPDGLSIERINNDGNYEPANCRWANRSDQKNNQRTCVYLEFDGQRMTRTQWARKLGMHPTTIKGRMRRGWTLAEALTVKPNEQARRT